MSSVSKPQGLVSEIDTDVKLRKYGVILGARKPDETGWDRLRQMYSYNKGRYSPELILVGNTAVLAGLAGCLVGGLNYGRFAKQEFIRSNKHNKFQDGRDYLRRLIDRQLLAMMRGGAKVAWRTSLFSGLYMLGVVSGAVYRDKFGLTEHILSGGLAAAIYRCHLGLRGMWFGTLIGMVFGTVGGILSVTAVKMSGVTMAQVRIDGYKAYMQIWEQEEREKHAKLAARLLTEEQTKLDDPAT